MREIICMLRRATHGIGPIRRRVVRLSLALVTLALSSTDARAEAADVASFLADDRAAVKRPVALRTSFEVEGVITGERERNPKLALQERLVTGLVYARNPTHEKEQTRFTEGLAPDRLQHEVRVIVQGAGTDFWLYKPDPRSDFAIKLLEPHTAASRDALGRHRVFLIDAWSHLGGEPSPR